MFFMKITFLQLCLSFPKYYILNGEKIWFAPIFWILLFGLDRNFVLKNAYIPSIFSIPDLIVLVSCDMYLAERLLAD